MTEEDAYKEGYDTLEEFKKTWIELHDRWDPDQEVWVYEFRLASSQSIPIGKAIKA